MIAKDNEHLVQLENRRAYSEIEKLTEQVIFEEENNFLYSGGILEYEKLFKTRVESNPEIVQKAAKEVGIERIKVSKAERLRMKKEITVIVRKRVKSIPPQYKKKFSSYLHSVANISGQDVINSITKVTGIKEQRFRLSNSFYKKQISSRVDKLVRSMEETTKTKLTNALLRGIDLHETKAQLVRRLQKDIKGMSKRRAATIVKTETAAAAEYMRQETAKMNGVSKKQWVTVLDEKSCSQCSALSGEIKPIGANFTGGFEAPPAHPRCRCFLSYNIEEDLCRKYRKVNKSALETIMERVEKKESDKVHTYEPNEATNSCVNPNALWGGGESLFGPDKEVGNYAEKLREPVTAQDIKRVMSNDTLFISTGKGKILKEAKDNLSEEGFIQLVRREGYKGNISFS